MKKRWIMLIFLLLAGCGLDTSATDIAPPEIDFDFDEAAVIVVPKTKIVQLIGEVSYLHFTMYTTYEQAAYLRRNALHITLGTGDFKFHDVTTTLGERKEIGESIFYEVDFMVMEKRAVFQEAPSEIHEVSLYIADTEIFTRAISVVTVEEFDGPVEPGLAIDIKQLTEDGIVYDMGNYTDAPVHVQQVYLEGAEAGGVVLLSSFPQIVEPGLQTGIYDELPVNDLRGLIMVVAQTEADGEQIVGLYEGPSNKEVYFQRLADMGY